MVFKQRSSTTEIIRIHISNSAVTLKQGAIDYENTMLEPTIVETKNNNKEYDLEWLKSYEGFEECTEEEAIETIKTLKELAEMVCTHLMNTS